MTLYDIQKGSLVETGYLANKRSSHDPNASLLKRYINIPSTSMKCSFPKAL
jgi:hypothetical protein